MSLRPAKKRRKPSVKDPSPPLRLLVQPSPGLFPTREELLRLAAVVAIAAFVAVACNYAAGVLNCRPRPFCDSGEVAQYPFSDLCEPCPENGQCSDGKLECVHGYTIHGRICIEDGVISQTAKMLSELIEHDVCDAHARVLCGENGKIWFKEADIVKMVNENKPKGIIGLKDDTFLLAKNKAIATAENFLETRTDPNGEKEFKCPDLLAELRKPLTCCVRQWIYRHILLVTTVFAFLIGALRFLWDVRRKKSLSTRAEQLYEQVCEILEDNAMRAKNLNNEGEPWVVASWLRDHLLQPKERKDSVLWKKVEELILEDSRIDQYPKLIKGESKIVLEWQVGGSLSSKMRTKGAARKTKTSDQHNVSSIHGPIKVNGGETLLS